MRFSGVRMSKKEAPRRALVMNRGPAMWEQKHASVATTGRYLHARPTHSSARYLGVCYE